MASELQKAINKLVSKEPRWRVFDPKPVVGGRPSARSTGFPGSTGGGVSLEERDATEREYWPAQPFTTSDGVFTFELEPIKSLTLTSGDKFKLAEPPAE